MKNVLFGLAGVISGVLGGMGMGGGTILIPVLTIFFGVSQHSAQAVNLVSFIPMATISLVIHIKNKYVVFKNVLYIIIAGLITCVIGYLIANALSGEMLKRIFGGFLSVLSIFQFIGCFKNQEQKK